MKALVKLKPEPGIELMEVPKPRLGHNDVLIKIRKTALCGTDMHIYRWDTWAQKIVTVPLTIGHEFVGEIVEIGEDVQQFKLGDRVSGEGHLACGICRNCRAGRRHVCLKHVSIGVTTAGCFADYLALPASNVYPVPSSITDAQAAILDPLGNATHTALSFDLVGEDVLITGAGPVGMMAVAIARHVGARHIVVTDVNEYHLNLAKKLGATLAINTQKTSLNDAMKQLDMQEGFDVGMEMSGHPLAFADMLSHMENAGKIALLGFLSNETRIDWNHVIMKGLTIKGIYGREMFETWYKMTSMMQSGLDISPVITHEFPVKNYQDAFDTLSSGQCGKVILNWD